LSGTKNIPRQNRFVRLNFGFADAGAAAAATERSALVSFRVAARNF
jgi:hypothetical protein